MLSDYHIHTNFSSDSKADPKDMIEAAIKKGLSDICITDHHDLYYPATEEGVDFLTDFTSYFDLMPQLRDFYKDKINVNIGIELGMQPHLGKENALIANEHPFDFIIGSSHLVSGMDPYYKDYWNDRDINASICQYFEEIIQSINAFDNFDVYGHIDYIIRYVPDNSFVYNPTDYYDYIHTVLKLLIEKGKGIEINTAGFKYGLNHPNPTESIINLYNELGGEIITVGSDAHKPEHIAYDFYKVPEILKNAGFRYYTIFSERKPTFVKLD
ncbi:MAG: histidinol-phosphatase HisJ family protein [Lachnospira sp.]|nr:histidinol-phosphatase HisJ family protein [Lachnospira sp.]